LYDTSHPAGAKESLKCAKGSSQFGSGQLAGCCVANVGSNTLRKKKKKKNPPRKTTQNEREQWQQPIGSDRARSAPKKKIP